MIDTDMTKAIAEKAQGDWTSQIPLGAARHAGRRGRGGLFSRLG